MSLLDLPSCSQTDHFFFLHGKVKCERGPPAPAETTRVAAWRTWQCAAGARRLLHGTVRKIFPSRSLCFFFLFVSCLFFRPLGQRKMRQFALVWLPGQSSCNEAFGVRRGSSPSCGTIHNTTPPPSTLLTPPASQGMFGTAQHLLSWQQNKRRGRV